MVTSSVSSVASARKPQCVLDPAVVNPETITNMRDIGLSFFASLCGRNRGAFVLQPTDGKTYGCADLPPNFAQLAGVQSSITFADVNALKDAYKEGNLTASETVEVLDYLVKTVYGSSANVDKDIYGCNVDGLAQLQCDPVNAIRTIRSVTLAGLFVPALWATGGKELTADEASRFYLSRDFADMRKIGLNTVQIPVPVSIFSSEKTDGDDSKALLSKILFRVGSNDLQAIIALVGEDNDDAVTAAAHYAAHHTSVFALTVPSKQSLSAARAAEPDLKLMFPIFEGDLINLEVPDENTFASLTLSHTGTVADVASSSALDDRMKLFYHEASACIARSPLEFGACIRRVPVFVGTGFDLAIDDCVNRDIAKRDRKVPFIDYGQCDRLDETVDSRWWSHHRSSFAARQLFSFEHGLGWSYAAWKLFDEDGDDNKATIGILDRFEKLLSLKEVVAAGLFPDLTDETGSAFPGQFACLNPPLADFIMGDATFAPTPSPPPDCGNGWWNYSINACTYWVPPPETAAPTVSPTAEYVAPLLPNPEITGAGKTELGEAGAAGAGLALLAVFAGGSLWKLFTGRRPGYSQVPSVRE